MSDYSHDSVLSIINDTNASALLSFLNLNDERYITIHRAFLSACLASKTCKRLMPSEFCGDVETWPDRPRFYGTTREPFRQILKAEAKGVEWTCVENGWFMDYFLPKEKSYMKPVPDEFPINLDTWTARVRGTGDEPQSWTLAREVGKAIVALLGSETAWVCLLPLFFLVRVLRADHIDTNSINKTSRTGTDHLRMRPMGHLQRSNQDHGILLQYTFPLSPPPPPQPPFHPFPLNIPTSPFLSPLINQSHQPHRTNFHPPFPETADRPIPRTHTPAAEIRDYVAANLDNDQVYAVQAVMCDEWCIDGATAVPKEKTLRQREKYFKDCKFSGLEEVLQMAKSKEGVL